ncbi:Magnesium transporter MgtE [Rosistilla ulvae]|uniref:Magnesium transporter MgtE n=1 Tax=Rosistilla ulvae TaxID=1930277 RepID=A0A517LX57_9BACT|nr:magnesium transporter [Rosistilla ulvae]QDS87205.1 Magnesium transporter MgtE [Rosistilla ulvae]
MNHLQLDPATEDEAPEAAGIAEIANLVATGEMADAVVALDRLSPDSQAEAVASLTPELAANLMEHVVEASAVEIIDHLPTSVAALILDEVTSDHRADLIAELSEANAAEIIDQMTPEEAADARTLMQYASDTAGGLMITEYVSFQADQTVRDVIEDLAENADEYRHYDIQYSFVCDGERLVGVLPLRDLLLSKRATPLRDIMVANPISVLDTMSLDDVEDLLESHAFLGVPVIDAQGDLLGVVQRAAVEYARSEQQRSDYLKSQGIVGGEEVRSLPLLDRSKRRLSWLSVNILLNIMAASVIAFFQDTLESVIALAVFLPIISDMSGCSGNQAVAVSMRELSLGLVKPNEALRVWFKEISVGILNGFTLGLLIATAAMLWKGDAMLGFVVGFALCMNTMIAVSFGGVVPLILKRAGVDPAIASGPLLTTITDMCGFFLVLGLASLLLV